MLALPMENHSIYDRHQQATTSSRLENDDLKHLNVLQQAFTKANKTGSLTNKMLIPSVCCMDAMPLWQQVLNNNIYNGLKKISLRWCAIQSQGVKLLVKGLQNNSCINNLETLNLLGNEIGVSGSRAISQLLAPGVDLDQFQVQDTQNILTRFQNVTYRGCIKKLILSYNCVSDGGCDFFGKALCINNTLATLELENCEIGDHGLKYLRRGIERNTKIKSLNIAANRFADLGVREIQSFLIRNSSITKFDVSRNRLGPQGAMYIAQGLIMNRSLKILRMNINRIGSRGAQLMAKMLINNHCLEELEISYNEIFNDGVQVLSQGITQNHGLKRIVLWYNGLQDLAATQLARALYDRSKLMHFRNVMFRAIAESHPEYFIVNSYDERSKKQQFNINSETYKICENIVKYLPVYMYFQIDLSHNQRITRHGINSLLDVANSETIALDGLREMLSTDYREREAAALAKTSLY